MDVSGVFVPLPFFLSLLNWALCFFSLFLLRSFEALNPSVPSLLYGYSSRGLFLAAHLLKTSEPGHRYCCL